jgi:hypothetical protein
MEVAEPSGRGQGGAEPERQRGRVSEARKAGLVATPCRCQARCDFLDEPSKSEGCHRLAEQAEDHPQALGGPRPQLCQDVRAAAAEHEPQRERHKEDIIEDARHRDEVGN